MIRITLAMAMLATMLIGCGNDNTPEAEAVDDTAISEETAVTEVGNSVCPVMGNSVVQGQYFHWEGYRIGICCPGCESAFRDAPEVYIPALLDDPAVPDEVKEGLAEIAGSDEGSL